MIMMDSFDLTDVRQRFAAKRAKLGASFRDLALELGINSSTLNRFETGRGNPNPDIFFAIRRWLGDTIIAHGAVIAAPNSDTIQSITQAIYHDARLTPAAAVFLSDLMERAYTLTTTESHG